MSKPYRRSAEWIDSLPEPLRSHMRASTRADERSAWRRRAANDDAHPPRDERPQVDEGTEPARRR